MNTYENEFYSQGYNAGVKIERVQKATRLLNRIKELESIVENQKVYIEREIRNGDPLKDTLAYLSVIESLKTCIDNAFNEGYETGVEAKTDDLNNTIDKLDDEVLRLRNLIKTEQHKKNNEFIPCKLCRMGEIIYLEYVHFQLDDNVLTINMPFEDSVVRIEIDFCPFCGERVNPQKSLSQ